MNTTERILGGTKLYRYPVTIANLGAHPFNGGVFDYNTGTYYPLVFWEVEKISISSDPHDNEQKDVYTVYIISDYGNATTFEDFRNNTKFVEVKSEEGNDVYLTMHGGTLTARDDATGVDTVIAQYSVKQYWAPLQFLLTNGMGAGITADLNRGGNINNNVANFTWTYTNGIVFLQDDSTITLGSPEEI